MITLIEDTRNQPGKHRLKNQYFNSQGIKVIRSKLPCGDYALLTDMSTVIDSKKDMQEIVANICGSQHERFRRECQLAHENGIKLIFLIENTCGIKTVQDVFKWHNERLDIFINSNEQIGWYRNGRPKYKRVRKYPKATTGVTLAKAMITMQAKYSCEFMFTTPQDSGGKIVEILTGEIK